MQVMAAVALGVLAVVTLALVVARVRAKRAGRTDPDDGSSDDNGGGNVRVPPHRPPDAPSSEDPEWWPEFERGFALYVRERTTRQRALGER